VSSLERIELLSFLNDLEYFCVLHHLGKIPMDAAETMIRLQTDLKLYNTMMSRDVNFRLSDVSSAMQNHDSSKYFQRLFNEGDKKIPSIIKRDKPILNIAVHNLLSYSEPIWQALGSRCVLIDVVRHPLYMIHQQASQMEDSTEGVRAFEIFYEYKGKSVSYLAEGWESKYLSANNFEKAVHYTNAFTLKNEVARDKLNQKYGNQIITIPFEPFVLNPKPWIEKVANFIGTSITESTMHTMFKQKIPREKVSACPDSDLYRRYGWTPPAQGASEREEISMKRKEISEKIDNETLLILDTLIKDYENKFWSPD